MHITKIELTNWRNFRSASADLNGTSYILGPNASGKSNFFDAFRFLRDIAKPAGGGLQAAVDVRGGIKKIRCLHARNPSYVGICIELTEGNSDKPTWKYELFVNLPARGKKQLEIVKEKVTRRGRNGWQKPIVERPNEDDEKDPLQLTESYLEQSRANQAFREIAEFLTGITYVHLVPQLLKFGDQIGGQLLADDPFGQGFMEQVARTAERTRNARLKRVEKALRQVIPHMEGLQFVQDEVTGHPHLEIRFKNYRAHGAKQREDQFSDGTLRLMSLLWLLQEGGDSPLLLEEPELSLNEEIVKQIPLLIDGVRRALKTKRQILISTHSYSLLSNSGIDGNSIIVLEPTKEGTDIRGVTDSERAALDAGFSPAEAVLPNARKMSREASGQFELKL